MKAVLYAAKSTLDPRGSIPTQLADAAALAEQEGMEVAARFSDEAASAYKGSRGPHLAAALAECERLAPCALVVQHSDRLARGDGKRAAHLVEYALWALKHDVTIRSVQDAQTFGDLLYAVVTGQRNHEDSARKSQAVRGGLKRRAERGQPVGALPLGYRVEDRDRKGSPRIIDAERATLVERMFDLAEQGRTPGEISRALNSDGAGTRRRKSWTTRAVRTVLRNRDYLGENGYPRLIEDAQFDAVQRLLAENGRMVEGRVRGVRLPDPEFVLAGLAVCALCGAAMRSRRCSTTGRRTYRCANAMEGRNLCPDSVPVPALEAEAFLVGGLRHYVGNLDAFLLDQVEDRQAEQQAREEALTNLRTGVTKLEATREKLLADYRRQVDEARSTAYLALEEVERVDGELLGLRQAYEDAQAVLEEHAGLPELDEARALYERLLAFARMELDHAATPAELRAVLRRVLTQVTLDARGRDPLVEGTLVSGTLRVVEPGPQTLVNRPGPPTAVPLPPLVIESPVVKRTPPVRWATTPQPERQQVWR